MKDLITEIGATPLAVTESQSKTFSGETIMRLPKKQSLQGFLQRVTKNSNALARSPNYFSSEMRFIFILGSVVI